MAQLPYRGNLQTNAFPLRSGLAGRSIIDTQADQTYNRDLNPEIGAPLDKGIPSVVYAHNVMPTSSGWQSVFYSPLYSVPAASVDFEDLHFCYAGEYGFDIEIDPDTEEEISVPGAPVPTGGRTYIALVRAATQSLLYRIDPATGVWTPIAGVADFLNIPLTTQLTSTLVNGVTYFFLSEIGAFVYNDLTDTAMPRELKSLDLVDIRGIAASNGYLLAWTGSSVAWSSSVDIEDFEPSDISGAGGGSLQEAQGPIIAAIHTVHGVLIVTEGNVVSAIYTGNDTYPWTFKAIPGSGGITSPLQISTTQAEQAYHLYTTNGIQQINHNRCKTALPHITDFISTGVFEDFDVATDELTQVITGDTLSHAISTITDRYIVVSYGLVTSDEFSHAIVLDLVLGRMGKLRIPHVKCFEAKALDLEEFDTPRDAFGFMRPDGSCRVLNFTQGNYADDAVIMLGKFQLTRSRRIELQELELENVGDSNTSQVSVYVSANGKDLGSKYTGYLYHQEQDLQHWLLEGVGVNATVQIKGNFNLVSYVLWLTMHGRY